MTNSTTSGPDTLITLFGRPGSGKTTVGDALERQGYRHLAMGRLLRDRAILQDIGIDEAEMQAARDAGRTIRNANLYPWLDRQISGSSSSVVVDGYPRVASAVSDFNRLVSALWPTTIVVSLHLRCPASEASTRVAQRGRDDDRSVDLAERNDEYDREQAPLIELLAPIVRRVDVDASQGSTKMLADVFESIETARREHLDRKA